MNDSTIHKGGAFSLKGVACMHYTLRGKIAKAHPYQLDKTLTVSGAGAEAEATGLAIEDAKKLAQNHIDNSANPHNVTKGQVGLGNVDNTSDMDKPVSTAQRTAIDEAANIGSAAQNEANNATNLANAAQRTADNAEANAGAAIDEAYTAQTTALDAYNVAIEARDKANSATEKATTAQATADEALTKANTIQTNIDKFKNPEALLKLTKVWENSNPSLAFPAETIDLSADTGAILYIVEYRLYCKGSGTHRTETVIPKHNTTLGAFYYEPAQNKFVWYTRNVTITESTAVFTDDSVEGEVGEYIVPVAIYAMHH